MSRPSLEEYAAGRPRRASGKAWCCTHIPPDLLRQIDAYLERCRAEDEPPRWRLMVEWLTSCGVEGVTVDRLRYHEDHR